MASVIPVDPAPLAPVRGSFFLAPPPLIGKVLFMTNKIALALGLLLVAVFAVDAYAYGGTLPVFLGKKLFDLLDWIAFWR
ncbi:hypothetical protein GCM10011358_18190 [Sinisalibacter lacisalsi]|uniref:Uncharacterized protein n=1 Tax=Sinisalibacter lacisalsi TaxID=1526570 RepID=A0ABQ1QN44_9RHOB|nr:hypothetical protein GCM10011358_18190 [Sinisalibacter lacisalsi]